MSPGRPSRGLVAVALLGGAVLLLVPLPWRDRTSAALQDLAHVPMGAVVGLLFLRLLPHDGRPVRRHLVALLLAAAFLGGFEALQRPPSRDASWADALAGVAGAAGALAIAWGGGRRGASRALAGAAGAVLLAAPCIVPGGVLLDVARQPGEFPVLSSLESPLEMGRWVFREARGERVPEHATHGAWALRVDLAPGAYPGATLLWGEGDWRGHATLALDVHLEGDAPLAMILKIADHAHRGEYHDRFHAEVALRPGPNVVRVSLSDVERAPRGRRMDLSRIALVTLFSAEPLRPRRIVLDHVRVER